MTSLTSILGGTSKALVRKSQIITANTSWPRPAAMHGNLVELDGIGGGSSGNFSSTATLRFGGDGGQWVIGLQVDIGSATSVSVVIGAGGAWLGTDSGSAGGTTSFGALLSLLGGGAIASGARPATPKGAPGRSGSETSIPGGATPLGQGGSPSPQGCAGGAGLILDATGPAVPAGAGAAGSAAQGYGAGGGGRGSGGSPLGPGAAGALRIHWYEVVEL